MDKKRIKVTHIIAGLNQGGAEMMLYKVLKYSDRNKYNIQVISMMDHGSLKEKILELGIPVDTLHIKRGEISIIALCKAIKLCKESDILQTWMYHADFLGFLISIFLRKKVIWGIHHANLEKGKNKRTTLSIAKINSFFSRWVDCIVSCSYKAEGVHIKYGYDKSKFIVIPNGFEIDRFYPITNARNILEKEFPILKGKVLFSLVARYDILKDHRNCIKALNIVQKKFSNFILLLCGTDMDKNNKELLSTIYENNLQEKILLLGKREDIPLIMSATDIYISSSSGEAFPNVIGEAMACGTPCVVTDVGDSAYMVGETGKVVERQNSIQLAEAILNFLNDNEYKEISQKCRERIIENFEIKNITRKYNSLWETV